MEDPETKLSRFLLEVVKMVVQERLQVGILGGVGYHPETPGYVTSFIRPGSKISVVDPVVIFYSMKDCRNNTLIFMI